MDSIFLFKLGLFSCLAVSLETMHLIFSFQFKTGEKPEASPTARVQSTAQARPKPHVSESNKPTATIQPERRKEPEPKTPNSAKGSISDKKSLSGSPAPVSTFLRNTDESRKFEFRIWSPNPEILVLNPENFTLNPYPYSR